MAYVTFSKATDPNPTETPFPDEDRITAEIVAHMAANQRAAAERHRHAHRDAHAKSHAVLKGHLSVLPGLAPAFAQGIFGTQRDYDILARISAAPGDIHSDDVAAPQGFALKILGVDGDRLLPDIGGANQDILMVNIPVLAFGDVGKYQKMLGPLEAKARAPDSLQRAGSAAARAAAGVIDALGGTPNATLQGLALARVHALGETFHSQGAVRYGDYIAKFSLAPEGPTATLTGQPIGDGYSAMRDAVGEWCRAQPTTYLLHAQLCTDAAAMPVEDAAVLWDPAASPHVPIARLHFPPQDPYTPGRQVAGDDMLSFNPWNGITAHQPLGSIMRVRKHAYDSSSRQRHTLNARPRHEPQSLADIAD
ncbi:hypothetical protein BVG79_p1000196 (plasmid) [Ketogulonicigenium robustum]|uniref:Catalase n=1 Tax=Ketogulonicigenium robustum TaxID=92947 RepID=A0A1W6P3B7_9RHOB|nr:catalase family protein [Ketogulonicigenium robustum]ARO15998.1 hypothetical protein BVG79_p1000196 [Ketogulonicigenium robustum]